MIRWVDGSTENIAWNAPSISRRFDGACLEAMGPLRLLLRVPFMRDSRRPSITPRLSIGSNTSKKSFDVLEKPRILHPEREPRVYTK